MTRTSKTIATTKAHPPSFVCPLTFEIMENPVMDKCAHSFERSAIVEWIARGNEFCPISRKQLSVDDLVSNHVLAERIEKWQWQQSQMETWKDEEKKTHVDETSVNDTSGHQHDSITRTPSDDDIELGYRQHGRILRKQKYEQVPSQFMLLPQEREVLQIVRARAEENRLKRRRRLIQLSLLVTLFIIVVFVLGLGVARYVSSNHSEEGPDEMTRRQDVDGIRIEDINDDAIIDV